MQPPILPERAAATRQFDYAAALLAQQQILDRHDMRVLNSP
jgi:hypothetical protein